MCHNPTDDHDVSEEIQTECLRINPGQSDEVHIQRLGEHVLVVTGGGSIFLHPPEDPSLDDDHHI